MSDLRQLLSEDAMEAMIDMRNCQPPKERLHYFDVVLENSTETTSTLLQKLYQDIISKNSVDFGQIPDSQGKLIHFRDYKTMSEAMDCLNKLFSGVESKEVDMMNRLHDQIISLQKDFSFGYQFDIDIIKITYCTAVMSLMEMINLCICAFTQYMRGQSQVTFGFTKVKKKDLVIIQTVKSLLRSFDSGEWNRLMQVVKKDPTLRSVSVATEGLAEDITAIHNLVDVGIGHMKGFTGGGKVWNFLKSIPMSKGGKVVGIVAAILALFFAIRKGIYYFFHGRKRASEWLQTEKEFVKACYQSDINSGNTDLTTEKKRKIADRLERMSDKIAVSSSSANAKAKQSMEKENRNSFSTTSIKEAGSTASGITF